MISLIIRKLFPSTAPSVSRNDALTHVHVAPKDQVSRAAKMLAEEYVRGQRRNSDAL